jgi:molybdopterin/thiamine biosynthesis adenylyltransferase
LQNKYSIYLDSLKNIENVKVWDSGEIEFDFIVKGNKFPLLFSFLNDNKLPFVSLRDPKKDFSHLSHSYHSDKNDLLYLCLSIRDDISVISKDYMEIIDYTLKRVERLLTMNEIEEKREYRKEFLYFWNKSSKNKKIPVYLNSSNTLRKLSQFIKNEEIVFVDENFNLNEMYFEKYRKRESNIIYIPLINSGKIMPPLEDNEWDESTLYYILNNCISVDNVGLLENIKFSSRNMYIIFEMNIPGVLPITYAIKLTFENSKEKNIYEKINAIRDIEYISIQRYDTDYLLKRIGVSHNYSTKKVMVVGAGSLGSYILSELPKLGVNEIGIVDDDDLSVENIMRHSLDIRYVNYKKVFGMTHKLQDSFPQVNVKPYNKSLNTSNIKELKFDQYDLIIIATGGTDFMISLNKYFHENKFSKPVLFSWIEAKGFGVHSLLVDYNKKGCYNCLYELGNQNKAHFGENNNGNQLIGTGCGGVFNPYGNIVLLKGTAMILEKIQRILYANGYKKNLLFSVKTTNRENFKHYEQKKAGSDFYISEECTVCGS